MEQEVKLFKALANPARLQILHLLAERPFCVNALVRRLSLSQPAISQHLKVLENAGFVQSNKDGYWVHYTLVSERIEECLAFLNHLKEGGEEHG